MKMKFKPLCVCVANETRGSDDLIAKALDFKASGNDIFTSEQTNKQQQRQQHVNIFQTVLVLDTRGATETLPMLVLP